ncbi:MAG TPA: AAA family ATPase [Mobilitalea sp.]|nr:AAA family ATPase [Mobilitalea sp.]
MMQTTVIAISNQKGGTGKTTTTVNLGIGLANEGKRVLLIDYDAQGNLTQSLGYPNPDELSTTISTLMEKVINEQPIEKNEGILHHSEGIDFVPANILLSGMETALVNVTCRERVLKNYINTVKDNYDYVLIDCTPSLGMLTVNALVAANEVIIPVLCETFCYAHLFSRMSYFLAAF